LATAAGVKAYDTKKYLKSQTRTQEMSYASQLELKQKELEAKRLLLQTQSNTGLYEDIQIKKLVILGSVSLIVVTILGLGIYYHFSVSDDEYEYVYE